jgi:hypothetical protein
MNMRSNTPVSGANCFEVWRIRLLGRCVHLDS